MEAESDDEFENASWAEEKDMERAAGRTALPSTPPGRESKRRRLNGPSVLSSSHRSSSGESDDFDPPRLPDGRDGHSAGEPHAADGWSRPPKRRVHIPKQTEAPKTTFQIGTQAPASSPYRIRGPRWKLPKPAPDAVCPVHISPREPLSPRSDSEDDAFDSSPHPVRHHPSGSSALECQGRPRALGVLSPTHSPGLIPSRPFAPDAANSASNLRRLPPPSPPLVVSGTAEAQPSLDVSGELDDLPSDAFDSSPSSDTAVNEASEVRQQSSVAQPQQRLVGPQTGLRQTTLFGSAVRESDAGPLSQSNQRRNWARAVADEAPTHHKLDGAAVQTWVYPTNLGTIRDYQFNIVQRGLFHNLLVALPTGLGKTFIAATIILNWFRWTKEAQIVFVAPTKPLVAQQIEACYGIVGLPKSQTTLLTGSVAPGIRDEEWRNKRVFFMTPQTLMNDLSHGRADPKKIVCVVVDEAHRATGGYAYVEVIKFIRRFNQSFRVLALTATPGASVEAVQEVIDGLDISRVEIRTEESLDIRQYVHRRNVEVITFEPSDEIVRMKDLFSKALQPVLDKLNQANACWIRDPMSLTAYGLTKARQQWITSPAGQSATMGHKGMMNAIFSTLASLAHSITLLKYHGIGPFYHNLLGFREEIEAGRKNSKYAKQVNESPYFQELMLVAHRWINDPDFIGHPKLQHLREVVLNHFLDAGEGRGTANGEPPSATRIMVFCQYRDSAEEIVRVLKRNEPMIRPRAFVGQAGAKGSDGMKQKTQSDVIQKFQQGTYNTLVATCVGEEGLDIGEVDLILCYDSSASPIRMLQRMGRTGRKRAGNIVLLLMRGKEEESFTKAKDGYEKMQQMIASGDRFTFHDELSPRILPKDIQPVVDKRTIDIPVENTQGDLPEPRRGKRAPKKAAKKFHMPDGVIAGFVNASRLHGDEEEEPESEDEHTKYLRQQMSAEERTPVASLEAVLLTKAEEKELGRRFQNVAGDEEVNVVSVARMDAFPARQRSLGRTKAVGHGQMCRRAVAMLNAMHDVDAGTVQRLEANAHADDRKAAEKTQQAKRLGRRRASTSAGSAGDAMGDGSSEPDLPSRRPLQQRTPAPTRGRIGSSAAEDEGDDGDMGGSIVDDNATPKKQTSSLTSTPPSLGGHDTRFYISPPRPSRRRSQSYESLPDFGTLVNKDGELEVSESVGQGQRSRQP